MLSCELAWETQFAEKLTSKKFPTVSACHQQEESQLFPCHFEERQVFVCSGNSGYRLCSCQQSDFVDKLLFITWSTISHKLKIVEYKMFHYWVLLCHWLSFKPLKSKDLFFTVLSDLFKMHLHFLKRYFFLWSP